MISDYSIRAARASDLPLLAPVELAAAQLLAGHAPESVLNEATSLEEFHAALEAGQLWVAIMGEAPVGFAHVEIIEANNAHLKEIDVHPHHGRRGLGTALVERVCAWAAAAGYDFVTLTTFRDVPWNAPFYARLGFEMMGDDELSLALRLIRQNETARGLDPDRRVAMRRFCKR